MARKIDYKKLDADDLEYLSTRGWLVEEGDYQGHDTSAAVKAWREDGTVPPTGEDEDDGVEYKDASVADLKAELASRELSTEGKKAELIARLEADDLEREDEEEDDEEPES